MPKILLNWVPTQSDFELMRKTLPDVEFEVPPWQNLEEAEILLYSPKTPDLDALIPNMKNLRFIQSLMAGVDHLPWSLIPNNVIVASGSGANSEAVADMALALALSALKFIPFYQNEMKMDLWKRRVSKDLDSLTAVILGTGSIGKAIAKRLKAFGMQVVGVSRSGNQVEGFDNVASSADWSSEPYGDLIVIALPLNRDSYHMIDKDVLSRLGGTRVIVNIARAAIVEPQALKVWLQENPTSVYASDVWWNEKLSLQPVVVEQPISISYLPNVIMTPHTAGLTEYAQERMLTMACENIRRFLEGWQPSGIVRKEDYSQTPWNEN
ncbi:MAG: hypothetical protein KBF90_01160 [Coprothermobacter sp.]|nr:hypothetical protein [Coprothermobacter sp.]